MPKFGFVGEKSVADMAQFNPKLVIAITNGSYAASKDLFDTLCTNITAEWFTMSYDEDERKDLLLELYDKIHAYGEDDLIVFACQMGQSRSHEAASVFAMLFNQDTLTSARRFVDCDNQIQVYSGRDYELLGGIGVESLSEKYRDLLAYREQETSK